MPKDRGHTLEVVHGRVARQSMVRGFDTVSGGRVLDQQRDHQKPGHPAIATVGRVLDILFVEK